MFHEKPMDLSVSTLVKEYRIWHLLPVPVMQPFPLCDFLIYFDLRVTSQQGFFHCKSTYYTVHLPKKQPEKSINSSLARSESLKTAQDSQAGKRMALIVCQCELKMRTSA